MQIVGADPQGSIYTAPKEEDIYQYCVEGVGKDCWPEVLDRDIIDRYIMVIDQQSFDATRAVARLEGLLIGGSCGMAAYAARTVAAEDPSRLDVVLLPDSGRGYLSKIWNDDWMTEHGFTVE